MEKHKINKDLIDYFRLNIGITMWCFDKTENESFVLNELTHTYLLENFIISESILKYYYLPTSRLIETAEVEGLTEPVFKKNIERALSPFSLIVFGGYFSRTDLNAKLSDIFFGVRDRKIKGKKVVYFEDLKPYFIEYAKGFEDGFNEFENKQIKPFLTLFSNKEDYISKVFEFVTKNIFLKHSWSNLRWGFCRNGKDEIINAFEDGQVIGFFYRAWSIILSNHKNYEQLFSNLYNEVNLKISNTFKLKEKRPPAKYFALLHKIKIELQIDSPFKLTPKGTNNRPAIEKCAVDNYGFKNGQPFYRAFINLEEIKDKKSIAQQYGKGYKQKLIKISDNDNRIIEELKNYPN